VVCDQAATNVAALRQLGFNESKPFFEIPNISHAVHVVFDVPHIVKNVRNNFQKHDVQVGVDTAKWSDVCKFYEAEKLQPLRLAPRLTDQHIDVSSVNTMRVNLAAQVLSHSVAAGIKTHVATKQLSSDALATSDFIDKMDTVFDLLNSRQVFADKSARCAIMAKNNLIDKLLNLKNWVAEWKFKGTCAPSAIKCHWGLQTSISSVVTLTKELLQEGFQFVCTSRFNQDCIENIFAGLRSKQGWNENPNNAQQFVYAFRKAVVLSLLDSSSSGRTALMTMILLLLVMSFQHLVNENRSVRLKVTKFQKQRRLRLPVHHVLS